MPPAARISDMHVCPMVTGLVPHVGGPIAMGLPTVLIGGMPAARVGDMATCVGPPDVIAKGSMGVFIGGMPAARMGDMTVHGGNIVIGMPTVQVGEMGGFSGMLAAATIKPTAAQVQEIQTALDEGRNQDAIDLTIQYYGIDIANVPNGVQYDATEPNYGVADFQGNINLGAAAMASPAVLASTIVHETTHANQAAAMREHDPSLTDWPNGTVDYDEAMAYESERRSAHNTGLDQDATEHGLVTQRRNNHYNNLSPDEQNSFDRGEYPP